MNARFIFALFTLGTLAACQTASYTSPGIQPTEARIIEQNYHWEPTRDPHHFTDAEVRALFAQSRKSNLTATAADQQSARLKWALAAVGDQHFAALLAQEPADVQQATLLSLAALWDDYKLSYPETQRLLLRLLN